MSKLTLEEMVFLYLTVSESAVSGAKFGKKKHAEADILRQLFHKWTTNPISKAKKLVFALFIISRKLKHYFQIFSIIVLTEHPLRSVIKNTEDIKMGIIRKTLWTQIRAKDNNQRAGLGGFYC